MPKRSDRGSLLNRVARRVGKVLQRAEDGIAVVREEASHPGRPQPHRVARNPVWRDADDRAADASAADTSAADTSAADTSAADTAQSAAYRPGGDTAVDPYARPADDGVAGDDAWYLRGDNEGWSATNPGGDGDD